jgi:hypothetical protein
MKEPSMNTTTRLIVLGLSFGLATTACKKSEAPAPAPAATPVTGTAAVSAPPTAAAPTPAGSSVATPAPGAPDFARQAADRRAEIAKLVAEVPVESEGAESAEAAARAFAVAASKKDEAAIKKLLLSQTDLKSFVPPDKLERTKSRVAAVLYRLRKGWFTGDVEIVAFKPGKTKDFKQGERGFTSSVTVLLRSQLEIKSAGKPQTLRFKSIVKMGSRWKVAEI